MKINRKFYISIMIIFIPKSAAVLPAFLIVQQGGIMGK